MASDQQVALTRTQRMPQPSSHISKSARQVVPAFLQKLYEMVNDPNNAELIRWSDAGDSFFVLDHERFAHEVLGRWFKHRNFSSFVRQLNMYGFHKIPHLQQGVLRSDTDTEFWNFAHANFHRGQPDLLCLIQRKKQMPQGDDGVIDLRDGNVTASITGGTANGSGNTAPSNGQVLDIQSILNGLTAIKRHQTTISDELNDLKRSNQLLWQDALASRAKHQKQQDTINRIVKFLAGVFGHVAGSPGGNGGKNGVSPNPHGKNEGEGGMMRRKALLMIEDGKRDRSKVGVEELPELPLELDTSMHNGNYPSIETPVSAPSPSPSVALSDNISVTDAPSYHSNNHNNVNLAVTSPTNDDNSAPSSKSSKTSIQPNSTLQTPTPQTAASQQELSRAVTPSRPPSQPVFDFDPRIQGMLSQLSPNQLQSLLSSLAAQTLTDPNLSAPSTNNTNPTASSAGLLAPYHQPPGFDFPMEPLHPNNPASSSSYNNDSIPVISPEGLISFDHYDPSGEVNLNMINDLALPQEQRLAAQWRGVEDITKDVNSVDSHLKTLIRDFGLDPSLMDEEALHNSIAGMGANDADARNIGGKVGDASMSTSDPSLLGIDSSDANSTSNGISTAGGDFDFESFFQNFAGSLGSMPASGSDTAGDNIIGDPDQIMGDASYGDMTGAASGAFLDEVATPTSSSDMTASSPVQGVRHISPEVSTTTSASQKGAAASATTGRKRKSEVTLDLDSTPPSTGVPGTGTISGAELRNVAGGIGTRSSTAAKNKRRKDK